MGRLRMMAALVVVLTFHALLASPFFSTQIPAFHHTSWDNAGLGAVYDVRQDIEGYIWLQSANGIYRFDGMNFLSVDQVTRGAIRNSSGLDAVLPAARGGIWFLTHSTGMILWKNGQVKLIKDNRCRGRLREAPDGSLWIAGSSGLFHLSGEVCQQVGKAWGMSTDVPSGLLVDREGTVWVKTWSGDLLFLVPGANKFQVSPYGGGRTDNLSFMHEAPDESVWLVDAHGLRQVRAAENQVMHARLPGVEHTNKDMFGDFAFSEDGSIWIANVDGARWSPRPEQWVTPAEMAVSAGQNLTKDQGLGSDVIWGMLVDRENSVWFATNSGLDQISRAAFHPLKLPHIQEHQFGIAPGSNGSVWMGSESLPLTHIQANKLSTYPKIGTITCLKQDRNGVLWVASKGENHLWRLEKGRFEKIPYPHEAQQPILSLAVDKQSSVWISLRQYGIFHLSGDVWNNENAGIGKSGNTMAGLTDDEEGNVWFSFDRKLVEWNGERYILSPLPGRVQRLAGSMLTAVRNHVWLPTESGIEVFTGENFRLLKFINPLLPGNITGLVETGNGDLWMNGFSGVTHVSRYEMAKWFVDPEHAVTAEHLDTLDGLPGLSGEAIPEPSLVSSNDGRLWFATTKGIAWLDPLTFEQSRNRVPPPVVVSSINADGETHEMKDTVYFAPHTEHVEFTFDALSFVVPRRVFFKYRLDGLEKEWHNAGTRREASYNSLKPGAYRFRVLACNDAGIWNEAGASISFKIEPAFYQTWWFRLLELFAGIYFVRLIWNLRIGMITRSLEGRLKARMEERERIARELHDTLLQGIFGLALRLQSSVDQLEDGHPVRADITQALNQSDAMMLKGRERIRGLRDNHFSDAGLLAILEAHGRQLQGVSLVQFRLSVDGEVRQLNAPIEEELSLIACEALTNAFRHAGASLIQLELVYRWSVLRLQIVDNGKGVDPSVLAAGGRQDHWGLPSMRERANKMHATFNIEPGRNNGTVVKVDVPGAIIYRAGEKNLYRFFSMFQRRRKKHIMNQ